MKLLKWTVELALIIGISALITINLYIFVCVGGYILNPNFDIQYIKCMFKPTIGVISFLFLINDIIK